MPAPLHPRIRCERERPRHTPGPHRAPLPLTHPPPGLPKLPGSPSVHPVLSALPGRFLPSCLSQASAVISYLHSCNRFHPAPSSLQAIRTHTLVSSPGLSLQGLFSGFSKPKEQRLYKLPQPLWGPEGSPLLKQALCLHQAAPSCPHPRHSASCFLCKPIKGQISDEMVPPQLLQSELTPPAYCNWCHTLSQVYRGDLE